MATPAGRDKRLTGVVEGCFDYFRRMSSWNVNYATVLAVVLAMVSAVYYV